MAGNYSGDVVRIYGFPDDGPGVPQLGGVFTAGHHYDRNVPCRGTRLELPEDGPSVHVGEQEVKKYEIRMIFVCEAEGRQAVTGPHD